MAAVGPGDTTTGGRRQPSGERIIIVVAFCRFAEAIAVGMIIPLLPAFLQELSRPTFSSQTDVELTAILYSTTGFAMAGIQVLSMFVSDIFDRRKPLILIGMLGATICAASFTMITEFRQLFGARVMQGICAGLTFPPLMAIVAYHSPAGKGGRVLGTYSTIRLFGFASGPFLGGVLSDFVEVRTILAISAALLFSSVVAVLFWVPDHAESVAHKEKRRVFPRVHWTFLLLGACLFLKMVGISAVISLFPYYQREWQASLRDLSFMHAAFIVTRCFFQYPMGWLGDIFDKKRVLLLGLAAFVPLVALQGYATSVSELVVLRIGLGVVSATLSACIAGISAERSESGNRASVMGVNTISFSLGVAVGPLLGGFLLIEEDPAPAFLLPAIAAIALALVVIVFVPSDKAARKRGRITDS